MDVIEARLISVHAIRIENELKAPKHPKEEKPTTIKQQNEELARTV